MRKIKFRAWNESSKTMTTPYLWINNENMAGQRLVDAPTHQLMQFTGLHDKNGREIYEGDIVKAHSFVFDGGEGDLCFTGVVTFTHDFCFGIKADRSTYAFFETSHFEEPCIEVIGNIHETPELLDGLK